MKTFDDLKFDPHSRSYVGFDKHAKMQFENGYGISVITGASAYTSEGAPYEVAVLHNNRLTYTTPITDDVIGHCTQERVTEIMKRIQQLNKEQGV